jgi:hypothetical protein
MTKGILYYSASELPENMEKICQKYISDSGLPITSVTIKPSTFGRNFVSPTPKSPQTFFENILLGLENMTEDIVFFCEDDILYHPEHFKFVPEKKDIYYYNGNYRHIRLSDGLAVHYDTSPLSGLCAYKDALIDHYRERVAYVKEHGYSSRIGYEPFTHRRIKWKTWYTKELFYPEFPNLDLYHGKNITRRKWAPEKFVTKPKFWKESTVQDIPGWPTLPEIVKEMNGI